MGIQFQWTNELIEVTNRALKPVKAFGLADAVTKPISGVMLPALKQILGTQNPPHDADPEQEHASYDEDPPQRSLVHRHWPIHKANATLHPNLPQGIGGTCD